MKTILEVKDLKKVFGSHRAVDGISFSVREGEIYGLLGPNGAGKSTSLSIICGLLKASSGTVIIGGQPMSKEAFSAKKLIGIVPQEPALYPQLSAATNLRFWGTINGVEKARLNEAVHRALHVVGLTDRAKSRVSKFSGGMKRRLNIAAGLIHDPKVIIMDEPTVGIDPQSRNHILETVKNLKEQGITILYTSHYFEEVEYLCDRVAIMDQGKIISEGAVGELLQQGSEYQELTFLLSASAGKLQGAVQKLPGVEKVFSFDKQLQISTPNAEEVMPLAMSAIAGCGAAVTEVKIHKPNLESLFLKLTGKGLRD